jgi:hypothetical protein
MSARRLLIPTACLIGLIALLHGGCVITVDPNDGGDGNGDGNGDGTAEQVTIRIVNTTPNTLDPEIYLSATPVDESGLFQASNKYTLFGVGRLGLLAGSDSESFTIDCAEARVVGTRGGSFGGGTDNNDLTDPAGTGTQRILVQDQVFTCGERITFTYRRSGDGFITTLDFDQ